MIPDRPRFRAASVAVASILALLGPSPSSWSDSGDATRSARGTSSFALNTQQGTRTIDITNVTFMTTGSHVPGRPEDERLLLRITRTSREVIDEKGLDAIATVEAWPLGADPADAPLYAVTRDGIDARVEDNAVIVFERGTEDVAWQSVLSLGTGVPLFDTFVPLLRLPPSPDSGWPNYVGFDIPPDNAIDERLRDPRVVGVLSYASPERTLDRLLLTCSDAEQAAALRSYWDTWRTLSWIHDFTAADRPTNKILITWRSADPGAPDAPAVPDETAVIPITGDILDVAHAQAPACMTLAPWPP